MKKVDLSNLTLLHEDGNPITFIEIMEFLGEQEASAIKNYRKALLVSGGVGGLAMIVCGGITFQIYKKMIRKI